MKKIYMVETLYGSDGYSEYFENEADAHEVFHDEAENKFVTAHLFWSVGIYAIETNIPFKKFQAYEKDMQKLYPNYENMKKYMNDNEYDIDEDDDFNKALEGFFENNIDYTRSNL